MTYTRNATIKTSVDLHPIMQLDIEFVVAANIQIRRQAHKNESQFSNNHFSGVSNGKKTFGTKILIAVSK